MNDLKFAWRQLWKHPGVTVICVLTLALGIGANSAVFSLIHSLLLRSLPYPAANELVRITETLPDGNYNSVSGGAFKDWQSQAKNFEHMAIFEGVRLNLTGRGIPIRVQGLKVSAEYLQVLGVGPALGRDFSAGEDRVGGANQLVMLTDGFWKRQFGAAPSILGQKLLLDLVPYTVIGVLPAGALLDDEAQFLIPTVMDSTSENWTRSGHFRDVIGRLGPGVTLEQAQLELRDIKKRSNNLYPDFKRDWSVAVLPLQDAYTFHTRPVLGVLMGTVALVLLIACANVSNLLLAQGQSRAREMAIRTALGASSWQIGRQLLFESLLLAAFGCTAGLLLATTGIKLLTDMISSYIPQVMQPQLNSSVLLFSILTSCGCGLLVGVLPSIRASGRDLHPVLKESERGSSSGSRGRIQSLLVASEYGFTLVLLICAGLFLRSFVQILNTDLGFNPNQTLAFDLSFPASKYPDDATRIRFLMSLKLSLQNLSGVKSVGVSSTLPLGSGGLTEFATRADRVSRKDYLVSCSFVSGDYFSATGMRLLRGRPILDADSTAGARRCLVIDQLVVRDLYGDEDPIGKTFNVSGQVWEIVGVVAPVRQFAVDRAPIPCVFGPLSFSSAQPSLSLRSTLPSSALFEPVRKVLNELDPDQPMANVRTLDQAVRNSLSLKRAITSLLGMFATVAILLACIGIYGVTSHAIGQRTRELSIRCLLGAQRADIIRMVVRQGILPCLAGVGVGLPLALGLTRAIRSQLFEIGPADGVVFGVSVALLLLLASVSVLVPACRAAYADPINGLRNE